MEEGIERLALIKLHYTKAHNALVKKGSQAKTYLKLQQKISEEMMGIRFTSNHRTPVRIGAQHG